MSQAARQIIEPELIDPEPEHESATQAESDVANRTLLGLVVDRARLGIRRHPLAAVGGAFAFGFVVGNGIPKFVAQTVARIGLSVLIQRVLEDASDGSGS